jgi:hypothetical protein
LQSSNHSSQKPEKNEKGLQTLGDRLKYIDGTFQSLLQCFPRLTTKT